MVSFYVFLALLGTDPVLSTAPVQCIKSHLQELERNP